MNRREKDNIPTALELLPGFRAFSQGEMLKKEVVEKELKTVSRVINYL